MKEVRNREVKLNNLPKLTTGLRQAWDPSLWLQKARSEGPGSTGSLGPH